MRAWWKRRRFMREHAFASPRLSHHLDGDLDDDDAHRVADHVSRCPECQRVLRTLRQSVESLLGLGAEVPAGVADRVIARLRAAG
ncbi:MAG: zf-HC2 domain-containing protein [Actinomycetota bacterium]|jgi:anti-sigma factor RsiW|nr:zf-HC2 domain-containing protein [Actinomycetota bacterium]MDQ3092944.1 zf-HC2 domain-containing protein [Actinomycetota bacterium]